MRDRDLRAKKDLSGAASRVSFGYPIRGLHRRSGVYRRAAQRESDVLPLRSPILGDSKHTSSECAPSLGLAVMMCLRETAKAGEEYGDLTTRAAGSRE